MWFSEEDVEFARNIDLYDLLTRSGETLKKAGREWKWKRHPSVMIRKNYWYRHSRGKGGDTIEFVKEFGNMNFPKAVKTLLEANGIRCIDSDEEKEEKPKDFILPEANSDMRRVYAYLTKTRGIDADVITHFVKEKKIYEEKQYHNVVFVAYDENGIAKNAHLKGTISKGKKFRKTIESSDFRYGFCHKGTSEKLYVFESAVDMMSFICLNKEGWQKHSYVALSGVSDMSMMYFLKANPHIKEVYLCLDNDEAGINARYRMKEGLETLKYIVNFLFPKLKDWNEDQQKKKNEEACEKQIGVMAL